MRLLVMFDLPTGNSTERKTYAQFRKFLIKDGYYMEQFSVYSRVLSSRDRAQSHLQRLKANLPPTGAVTALLLTEKQYEERAILIDTRPAQKYEELGPQLTMSF
jgi:CRISPR-associated protein Cas2